MYISSMVSNIPDQAGDDSVAKNNWTKDEALAVGLVFADVEYKST